MASIDSFRTDSGMTQSDAGVSRRDTRENASMDPGTPPARNSLLPIAAVAIAACFGAGAWFYYQNDSANAVSQTAASTPSSLNANGTIIPATAERSLSAAGTTFEQSSTFGKPDILVTVHPDAAQLRESAAKATVQRPMLAKATSKRAVAPTVAASTKVSRAVALTTRPQPIYPSQALRTREQGTVLVLAQVDVNGKVSDARVVRRSGSPTLDRAAPNEVRRWKFAPALRDGQPIMASVEIPVSYRLEP